MKGQQEQEESKKESRIGQLRIRKVINQKIEIKSAGNKTLKQLIHELNNQIFDEELERKYETFLNETIFIFNVIYDGQNWEIRRTIKQFQKLEEDITNNAIKYFFKTKEIMKSLILNDLEKTQKNLLSFLKIYSSNEIIPECVLHFLELSSIYLPLKVKECFMQKKSGGRYNQNNCQKCQQSVSSWEKRYFIITQSSLLYLKGPDEHNCQIRECLSFDYSFDFQYGKKQTGEETGIIVQFSQRKLKIKAPNLHTYLDFIYSLFLAKQKSPYTKLHRFESFSPIRHSECKWYVDGDQYFNDVYEAIQSAKEMIYITDWWLSPELYLKRPVNSREFVIETENRKSRIDLVLEDAANNRNVIVLILLYNAPFLLYNNPKYTKQQLEKKSKNIRVLKHPSQLPPFLFSHHEKMVVIDQTIAFMGGLDLCFGRWDDQRHLLFDIHPYDQLWPQIDFSNSRVRDFVEVQNYQKTLLKENEPRMPWHDIAIQIQGDSVIDLARHFVQYWNHVMMGKLKNKKQVLIHANDLKIESTQTTQQSEISNLSSDTNLIYIGKKESIVQMKQPFLINHQDDNNQCINFCDIEMNKPQNSFQINTKSENKNIQISNIKVANKIIQIIVKEDENQYYISQIKSKQQKPVKQQVNQKNQQHSNAEGIQSKIKLEYFEPIIISQDQKKTCITQLTRSSSKWSTGIKYVEHSIQNAYVELILNAKQFIYIENQFFMSDSAGDPLENKVSTALIERIKEANQKKQKFKVIVFLPLLPGFEGEIDQDNSTVLKIQLHYEYLTISRGGNSIIEQLRQTGINPSDYINFYGLRQHAKSDNNIPVTEIIYIHSKLMIVDDEIALIGSANINDRSLLGKRDSELAIIVQDQMLIDSVMNEQQVKIPKFAHTLRVNLYSEHFGLESEEVQDPLSPLLEKEIKIRTSVNTKMYKEIFACYPDDKIKTVADYAVFKQGKKLELYDQYSTFIKGHAVEFPLQFLCNENLKIPVSCKEYYVSDISFT